MTKRYKYEEWGETSSSFEGKRFRRNKIDGVLGGVCAGIGDYTGIDPVIVRIITVVLFFIALGPIIFLIYLGLWIFVPSDKRAPYYREYREAREAAEDARHASRKARKAARRADDAAQSPYRPTASFRDVKSKYRSLEARLADLEKSITSSEWQLRREFRDLENK